ncbi:serine/threonine-protein kinase [Adhaeretor mobilis]|uniref:Serine/threonine-protein kinase PrkC n=1 Tax=Adhaeretor mobilis TaxID=1930276 RepID=A0A517MX22_9BACT|nr:serine/threonine-protein kinase [Adhaeretor mobilis]QDS99419.1 Serine/threonine-protein kinase PrkC [Adhaeretor mobilis]
MDPSTTILQGTRTITYGGDESNRCPSDLLERYEKLLDSQHIGWTEHLRFRRLLGTGGQGVVYLSDRRGCDGFTLPVALKLFSPERFVSQQTYDEAMGRMGDVSCRVAQIQHDSLLDVQNFIERSGIRMMEMEWVDGYDLERLLTPAMLSRVEQRVAKRRWHYINNVVVTSGPIRPRLKPGIAVAIVRQCLGALAALHREDIIHGDIKPANVMVKRTGAAKIVDIGSALHLEDMPEHRTCTPQYAAPEMLERNEFTKQSDLASVGYVLIEILAGRPLFAGLKSLAELLEAKWTLPKRLEDILPDEVADSELLMSVCRRLTNPDPLLRYKSADDANTGPEGLAEFQRSLIIGDLASEYDNELRVWLEELD